MVEKVKQLNSFSELVSISKLQLPFFPFKCIFLRKKSKILYLFDFQFKIYEKY